MNKIKEHNLKMIDRDKFYNSSDAVDLLLSCQPVKFDQTIDVAINLGVDPRHADQMIRGAIALPEGTGKEVRICVITSGDKIKLAEEAGADFLPRLAHHRFFEQKVKLKI